MSDTRIVAIGLAIFVVVVAFPVWYTHAAGEPGQRPELEKPKGDSCVREKEWITPWHMDLLNTWRDEVVRQGDRFFELNGKQYEKSLTKTCMSCHADRKTFCDRCHAYADVDPFCWDCHVDQKGE